MGHYASEMMPENPEFDKLNREIDRLGKRLANSPLSAFTVGDLPKIQKLLGSSRSSMYINEHTLQGMKNEIVQLRAYLAKVPK